MPRNVEIKARLEDFDALVQKAAEIADSGPIDIVQDDTFFPCDAGRLKLRILSESEGELIFYQRADDGGPKESYYIRSATANPAGLLDLLSHAYGTTGRVRKRRKLFLAGRTRIHIDRIAGLGDYLELEVVLQEGEPVEAGIEEARELMSKLGIDHSQLVRGAYVDLIRKSDA